MIILFENYNYEPDLRKMPEYVLCIRNHKNRYGDITFNKDSFYTVDKVYGDPQGAQEKYNLEYTPVDLIHRVNIIDENNLHTSFKVCGWGAYPLFFDYFEIPEFSDDIKKYNL